MNAKSVDRFKSDITSVLARESMRTCCYFFFEFGNASRSQASLFATWQVRELREFASTPVVSVAELENSVARITNSSRRIGARLACGGDMSVEAGPSDSQFSAEFAHIGPGIRH